MRRRSSDLEIRNVGKPALDHRLRDGPHRRQLALLRGRRPLPRGPGRRRVHGGPHVVHAPRPARRRRVDRAVELPAQHGDVEARPRARGRQHRGAEAVGAHAAHRAAARGDHRRHPAAGRAQRRDRRRARPRARRSCAHPDVAMVSLTGDVATGKAHRPGRGRLAQARPPRARRQGAGDRVRRRRRRGARRDAHRDRLLQLGPGLHRAVPRDRRARACSTTSSARLTDSVGEIVTGDPFDEDTAMGPVISGEQLARVQRHGRPRAPTPAPRSPSAARRATAPASSTSRRSS